MEKVDTPGELEEKKATHGYQCGMPTKLVQCTRYQVRGTDAVDGGNTTWRSLPLPATFSQERS